MSHFTVLVVGEDIDKALAPFQENNVGDCPEEFLKFIDKEDECRVEYETGSTEKVLCPDGSVVWPWDPQFRIQEARVWETDHVIPEGQGYETVTRPFKEWYPTFEEFMQDYHGLGLRDPEKGRFGHWDNPNAQWDWYTVGGRWDGFFKLKDTAIKQAMGGTPRRLSGKENKRAVKKLLKRYHTWYKNQESASTELNDTTPSNWVNQARKKDIDFDGMIVAAGVHAAENWDQKMGELAEAEFNGSPITPEKVALALWRIGANEGTTRSIYIEDRRKNAVTTHAVLKDGDWFEHGEMGRWGCVSNEKAACNWKDEFMALMDEIPEDSLLTIVDCHI